MYRNDACVPASHHYPPAHAHSLTHEGHYDRLPHNPSLTCSLSPTCIRTHSLTHALPYTRTLAYTSLHTHTCLHTQGHHEISPVYRLHGRDRPWSHTLVLKPQFYRITTPLTPLPPSPLLKPQSSFCSSFLCIVLVCAAFTPADNHHCADTTYSCVQLHCHRNRYSILCNTMIVIL
jgi:hypothetical protein